MSSTSASPHPHHRHAHLTTGQLRGCVSRLLTQFEGACCRPLLKEVALTTEEMRREKLESFGGAGAEGAGGQGEGGKISKQSSESDSSWAEVSSALS